jgi:hypothetical protein
MSDEFPNTLLRIALPIVRGENGDLSLMDGVAVVMNCVDQSPASDVIDLDTPIVGWIVAWCHPRSMAVGMLSATSELGGPCQLPFGAVWGVVQRLPVDRIRRAALSYLANP